MVNNRLIKSFYKNTQIRRYSLVLCLLFLLAPVTWVIAFVVNPTFEDVGDVRFFTRVLNTTINKEVIRVRAKNNSAQTITGSFRLIVGDTRLPIKGAAGITEQGEAYFLFKKGAIQTIPPRRSIRTRISTVPLENDDIYNSDHDIPSKYNFRLERRIRPQFNNQPVAKAGFDQRRRRGDTVYLDASQSFDLDGERLNYHWVMERKPAKSTATLFNSNTVNPYFVIDVRGKYAFALYVNDGIENSLYDRVKIRTKNLRPVAHAGGNQLIVPGDSAQLDGSASTDANGDLLSYTWFLEALPEGSLAALDNVNAIQPKLSTDLSGKYVVRLKVNDGKRDSKTDRVVITDGTLQPVANAGVDQAATVSTIIQLDASASYALDAQPLTYRWSLSQH